MRQIMYILYVNCYLLHAMYEALLQLLQALMLQAAPAVLSPGTPVDPCLPSSRAIPGGQLRLGLAGGAVASSPWGASGSPEASCKALAERPSHVRAQMTMHIGDWCPLICVLRSKTACGAKFGM